MRVHPHALTRCASDEDTATVLLEARWFAAVRAIHGVKGECEQLREAAELARAAWRRARAQLERLEAIEEALGAELAEREAFVARPPSPALQGAAVHASGAHSPAAPQAVSSAA